MALTAEEIQAIKRASRNLRFKIDDEWQSPLGYKGRL